LQKKHQVVHFSRNTKQDCFKELLDYGVILQELDFMDINEGSLEHKRLSELMKINSPERLVFAQRSREVEFTKFLQIDINAVCLICEMFASCNDSTRKTALIFTSPAAKFVQSTQPVGYHVGKAAQLQMARFYAANFKKYGIRINCLAPGAFVEKERSKNFYLEKTDLTSRIKKIVPTGQFTKIQEIVAVADFLLGEKSNFINGQEIYLDGGLSLLDQSMFFSE
jgi:NAD(P)-dependent dehydrogenase (short-subunit alcohol dehydrogenase family)